MSRYPRKAVCHSCNSPLLQALQKLVLHNPVTLKLEETEADAARLAQWYMK